MRDKCPRCGEEYIIFEGEGPEVGELCGADMRDSTDTPIEGEK